MVVSLVIVVLVPVVADIHHGLITVARIHRYWFECGSFVCVVVDEECRSCQ